MKPLAQINVIPFIDIMLVLLAVVLTTATFIAQGRIPVSLPSATHSERVTDERVIQLTVDTKGQLYRDDQLLSLEDFALFLDSVDAATPVRLRVDAHAAFEHFVAVIDHLKAHGLTNVAILTRQAER